MRRFSKSPERETELWTKCEIDRQVGPKARAVKSAGLQVSLGFSFQTSRWACSKSRICEKSPHSLLSYLRPAEVPRQCQWRAFRAFLSHTYGVLCFCFYFRVCVCVCVWLKSAPLEVGTQNALSNWVAIENAGQTFQCCRKAFLFYF
jgi:hypothetical protein